MGYLLSALIVHTVHEKSECYHGHVIDLEIGNN